MYFIFLISKTNITCYISLIIYYILYIIYYLLLNPILRNTVFSKVTFTASYKKTYFNIFTIFQALCSIYTVKARWPAIRQKFKFKLVHIRPFLHSSGQKKIHRPKLLPCNHTPNTLEYSRVSFLTLQGTALPVYRLLLCRCQTQ